MNRVARAGPVVRYGIALVGVLAGVGLRLVLAPALDQSAPYAALYVAVVAVSLLAGRGPAILTMCAGAAAADYFVVEQVSAFRFLSAEHVASLVFYFVVSISVIVAIDSQAKAADLARRRLHDLEAEQEKRAAAERERERQQRWATQTLSSIGDGVITTDANGRVTFLNRVAAELTGWAPEEAGGQAVEKVFHIVNEQTGEAIASPIARVLRDGIVVGLANHTALIRRDGTVLPIDDSGAPIRDDNSEILGAVLVFRDFTERRRREEADARLAAIVRCSQDAVISKSLEGIIQTWNPGAEKLFGYSAAEAVGRSMAFLIPADRQHEESRIVETVRAGRDLQHFETARRRKDGTEIHVSMSVSPLYNSYGEVSGISHIARDITEQKQLHAQLLQAQKLESLGVLAGGVAHDFNNLLTGIIGSASLLEETLPPGGAEAALVGYITKAGDRAAQLTQQLLAYSGKGRFVVQRIDPAGAIREIVELLRASIPRTVELALEIPESLPWIEVDEAQFQQLLMNLAINGAEAMEGRPGSVKVGTAARYVSSEEIAAHHELAGIEPGEYVSVRVEDSGCGMTAATLARIFDPFFTTKFTGRGLGLAAVQGIVRGHRGAIRVESTPGRGTRFEVLLPVAYRRKPAGAAGEPESGKPAILVIDDEEVVRETARLSLERAGFRVLTAENGAEGVALCERHGDGVALVLLDLTMPVLAGAETLERIRALRPGLPVLLCSGYNEADAMRQVSGSNLAGFVKKPFTAESLKAKVATALGR